MPGAETADSPRPLAVANRSRDRRDIELFFEGVNELGELENGHATDGFEQLFLIRHGSCLLMLADPAPAIDLTL